MGRRKADPLMGEGRRPADPYVRIIWAAERGQGCTLSADEVAALWRDSAIQQVAWDRANPELAEGELAWPRA